MWARLSDFGIMFGTGVSGAGRFVAAHVPRVTAIVIRADFFSGPA